MIIERPIEYIIKTQKKFNDSFYMNDYYEKADVLDILPTNKVLTMCTDGSNIYYNPNFINDLTPKEIAFIILHQCVHQI